MTLDEWIIYGRVGISSKTMWAVLKNIEVEKDYGDIPYDPDDFSRCFELIVKCELTKKDLNKISDKLPYWKPFIDSWDKLNKMYAENINTNWDKCKEIGMFEFMQELVDESRKIKYN